MEVRPGILIGLVLAGALMGALAGWNLRPSGGVGDAGLGEAHPTAPKGLAEPALPSGSASESSPRLGGAPRVGTQAARGDAGAVAATPTDLPPAAAGIIRGRVLRKDGSPVAGATLRCTSYAPSTLVYTPGDVPPVQSLEERLDATRRAAAWDQATRRESETDGEGRFVLGDLRELDYVVQAYAPGHVMRLARGSSGRVRPGGVVDFTAERFVWLDVDLQLPDGRPAREATIRWRHPEWGGGGAATWIGSSPRVAIEPGVWEIHAEAPPTQVSDPVRLEVGEAPAPLTLRLKSIAYLAGTLRFDPADQGWNHAILTARPRVPGEAPVPATSAWPPVWAFRFDDLVPGTYDVEVALVEGNPVASATFDATRGLDELVLTVPRLTAAQVLRVRVLGPDGEPLAAKGTSFALTRRGERGASSHGARWGRREDGVFLVGLGTPQGISPRAAVEGPVQHLLVVQSERHGKKEAPYQPGLTETLEVSFP